MNGLKLPALGLELGSTRIKAVLTDGAGAPLQNPTVFVYGCEGVSNTQAWFTFPAMTEFPSELYLAPMDYATGSYNLAKSIRVR